MYKSAVILIMTTVLALAVVLVGLQTVMVVEMLALVDERAGAVQVLRDDKVRPAEVGMLVRAGERVRTGADGRVGLHWADGSRAKVGPDSELVIQRCRANQLRHNRTTHFRLNLGEIWIRVHGVLNPGSKFEVETPTIVAAVRGTIFGLKVFRDGTTQLEVYRGQVDIVGDGVSQEVTAGTSGQCAVVGKRRFEMQRMSAAEAVRWGGETGIVGPFLEVTEPASGEGREQEVGSRKQEEAGGLPSSSPISHPPLTVTSSLIPVSGRTEDLTRITVNGKRVRVNLKGAFRTRVQLTEGRNLITVVATQGRARSSVTREITYINPTQVIALTCRPSDDRHDPAGTIELTAVLRDGSGNLVPDGTAVELVAEGGSIEGAPVGAQGLAPLLTRCGAVTAKWRPSDGVSSALVTASSGSATATVRVPPLRMSR